MRLRHARSWLCLYFERCLQLDRHAQGETGNADDRPNSHILFSEHIAKEIGSAVSDTGMIDKARRSCDKNPEPDDPRNPVECAQMMSNRRQSAQGRNAGCLPSCLGIEFSSNQANKCRFVIDDGQHTAQEKQIPGLQSLNV